MCSSDLVAKAFPEFISLTEPQPLAIAETQALLGSDEALVAILSGSTATFVWAVTRERADWIEVSVGASDIEATVAALRRGLDIDTPTAESKPGAGPTTTVGGFESTAADGPAAQLESGPAPKVQQALKASGK